MECCEVEALLIRINRLSEIALEFHGENLGEHAAQEIVDSAMDLSGILDDDGDDEVVELENNERNVGEEV